MARSGASASWLHTRPWIRVSGRTADAAGLSVTPMSNFRSRAEPPTPFQASAAAARPRRCRPRRTPPRRAPPPAAGGGLPQPPPQVMGLPQPPRPPPPAARYPARLMWHGAALRARPVSVCGPLSAIGLMAPPAPPALPLPPLGPCPPCPAAATSPAPRALRPPAGPRPWRRRLLLISPPPSPPRPVYMEWTPTSGWTLAGPLLAAEGGPGLPPAADAVGDPPASEDVD